MTAIVATSRKIAVIIYKMLTTKQAFCYDVSSDEMVKVKEYRVKKALKVLRESEVPLEKLQDLFAS